MALEPDVALLMTASSSLARKQILADFLQSIAKQRIPPEGLSKVTIGVFFSRHLVRCLLQSSFIGQVSVELEDLVVLCRTNAQFYGYHGNLLIYMRFSWLSRPKRFPTPALKDRELSP